MDLFFIITGKQKKERSRGPACHVKNAEQHILHFVDRMEGDLQTNIIGLVYLQDAQLFIEILGNVSVCKRRFWGHFRNMTAKQIQWWIVFFWIQKQYADAMQSSTQTIWMMIVIKLEQTYLSFFKTNVTHPLSCVFFLFGKTQNEENNTKQKAWRPKQCHGVQYNDKMFNGYHAI